MKALTLIFCVLLVAAGNLFANKDWQEKKYLTDGIVMMASNGDVVFLVAGDDLYRSNNGGDSWSKVNTGLSNINKLNWVDFDGSEIYVSGGDGIIKTTGFNFTNWQWDFFWTWDPDYTWGVTVQNGIGYAGISSYGGMSGPIKRESGIWIEKAGTPVITDSTYEHGTSLPTAKWAFMDPKNFDIAYIYGERYWSWGFYRTMDGGENWDIKVTGSYNPIIYICVLNGKTHLLTQSAYSNNYGNSWQNIGVDFGTTAYVTAYIKDEILYAARKFWDEDKEGYSYDVLRGQINNWERIGLFTTERIKSLAVAQGYLIGTDGSNIYRIAIDDIDISLPVELQLFTAEVFDENKIKLHWETATEKNNYGFEIQRRRAGEDWEKIKFVSGAGTVNKKIEYSFIDTVMGATEVDYRLRQVDLGGNFSFSHVIKVNLKFPNEYILDQNYPNPFNSTTVIEYSLPQEDRINLSIYDVTGRLVKTVVDQEQVAGHYAVNWDGKNSTGVQLPTGIYYCVLRTSNNIFSKKIVFIR